MFNRMSGMKFVLRHAHARKTLLTRGAEQNTQHIFDTAGYEFTILVRILQSSGLRGNEESVSENALHSDHRQSHKL